MPRHRSSGWGQHRAPLGGQRARYTERHKINDRVPGAARTKAAKELLDEVRWMQFHENELMPARRRGGEADVRSTLQKAQTIGLIRMTGEQIEQEVRDVMAAPDVTA